MSCRKSSGCGNFDVSACLTTRVMIAKLYCCWCACGASRFVESTWYPISTLNLILNLGFPKSRYPQIIQNLTILALKRMVSWIPHFKKPPHQCEIMDSQCEQLINSTFISSQFQSVLKHEAATFNHMKSFNESDR